jgi:tetratricopeptide (TPR) repeat protein
MHKRTTAICVALSMLLCPAWLPVALAEGARGQVRLLEGLDRDDAPPAKPRVETWTITQAVAWVDDDGDIELVLLTDDADITGFAQALDPAAWWAYENLGAPGIRRLKVGVSEVPSHSSAFAYIGDEVFTPASSGTVYGARIEAGRLRGRLVTIGGLHGSLYADVQVDVPLWQPPPHRKLPSDGGEPGAALRALDAAVQAGDASAFRALMKPSLVDQLPDGPEFTRQLELFRRFIGQDHRVQQGLVNGGMAVLLSTANRRGRAETVRTVWLRVGERWLFDELTGSATALLQDVPAPKAFTEVEPEPATLADQPVVRLDESTSMTLRHARALALASGEHLVLLSDQPLSTRARAPATAEALSWSAWSDVPGAQLAVIRLPAGGPTWDLDDIEHKPASGRRDTHLVRGELTRIGTHLSGVVTTLRFPDSGGVETGETVLLDLQVEEPAAAAAAAPAPPARPLSASEQRKVDEARSLMADALALRVRGDHAAALAAYERALMVLRGALPRAHVEVLSAEVEVAAAENDAGRYDEARARVLEAIDAYAALPDPPPADVASAYNALGYGYHHQGRLEEAVAAYLEARPRYLDAEGSESVDYARLLSNLSESYRMLRRIDDAAPLAEESFAIAARLPDVGADTRSMIINNLATVRFSEGRADQAQALFEQSLELTVAEFGDEHPRTATAWSNIGVSLYAQRRHREAIAPLEKALAIMEQAYGPSHAEVAYVLSNLADVYEAAGEAQRAEEARGRIASIEGGGG